MQNLVVPVKLFGQAMEQTQVGQTSPADVATPTIWEHILEESG